MQMPKFYWGYEYLHAGQTQTGLKYYGLYLGGFQIGYWKRP